MVPRHRCFLRRGASSTPFSASLSHLPTALHPFPGTLRLSPVRFPQQHSMLSSSSSSVSSTPLILFLGASSPPRFFATSTAAKPRASSSASPPPSSSSSSSSSSAPPPSSPTRAWLEGAEARLKRKKGKGGATVDAEAVARGKARERSQRTLRAELAEAARQGDLHEANRLWEELRAQLGARVDASSCHALMNAYAQRGHIRRVLALYAKMKEWRVRPTATTYSIIFNSFANLHQPSPHFLPRIKELREKDMPKSVLPPPPSPLAVAVAVADGGGGDGGGGDLVGVRCRHGVMPTLEIYNVLLKTYLALDPTKSKQGWPPQHNRILVLCAFLCCSHTHAIDCHRAKRWRLSLRR